MKAKLGRGWIKNRKPSESGTYPALLVREGELETWLAEFYKPAGSWSDGITEDVTIEVVAWMEWPSYEEIEAADGA